MESLLLFFVPLLLYYLHFSTMRRRLTEKHAAEMARLQEAHRQAFQDLISKVNHGGPIKEGATALGLTNLISWAITNTINNLQKRYEARDWNTAEPITELREIVMVELRLLHNRITAYSEAIRTHLREYNHKQEK
jgi:hypothetical protein